MYKTLFKTDFYQMTMVVAYMLNDMANDRTGFEAYVRRVKCGESYDGTHYVSAGNEAINKAMYEIREDMKNMPALFDLFWGIIKLKVDNKYYEPLKVKWLTLDCQFEFNMLPDDSVVKPFVPIFQYNGPKWIGQLIETYVLNTVNGVIGLRTLATAANCARDGENDILPLVPIVDGARGTLTYRNYIKDVKYRLQDYRGSTKSILLEAGFRRAPGYELAVDVAALAVNEFGWDGTSNVAAYLEGLVPLEKIGGSCAHSFVMSFNREIDAFRTWNNIFPNLTILVDTYDTMGAIKELIKCGIKPPDIRIDSEPLDELAFEARKYMNENGWGDVGIFLSGDMTPVRLLNFKERYVPMEKTMAGTMLMNIGDMSRVNTGMVYKLVEYEDKNGITHYPEKKSNGKGSVKALKKLVVDNNGYHFERGFDLSQAKDLTPDTVYDFSNNFSGVEL